MNTVNILGRLARNPELRYTQTLRAVASFTIAVDRIYKAEGQQTADFINCLAWNKTAENIEKYFQKGNKIAITGRLQTRSWEDNDGKTRYATEVVVENFDFCESANANTGTSTKTKTSVSSSSNAVRNQATTSEDSFFNLDINEDGLPF